MNFKKIFGSIIDIGGIGMGNAYDNRDRFIPLVNKMWDLYRFIDMDKDAYFNFLIEGFKSYTYDEEGEVAFYDFYHKAIIEITTQYIKEAFENKNYRILFNYIDTIWKDSDMRESISYKKAIAGLKRIDSLMVSLDFEFGADELTNIISTNQKLKMAIDAIVAKDKKVIESGNFSKYGKTTTILVEAYCIENGISFQNEDEDDFSIDEELDFEQADDKTGFDARVASVSDFSSMEFYYQLMREYPVLKPEEVRALVLEMQGGSQKAKDKLVYSNIRLVVSIARKFIGRGVAFDDLVQEGIFGLTKAIERYDLDRNTVLSTYATWWIRQSIQRCAEDFGRNIKIPVYIIEKVNRLERAIKNLTIEYGREPRINEIAEKLNMSEKQVEELYSYRNDTISLNKRVDDDEETELGAFVASEETLEEAYLSPAMEEIIEICKDAGVKDKELYILLSHLTSDEKTTLEDLGQKYGITRERIRQIEEKALKKIAGSRYADKLAVYASNPDLTLETFKRYRRNRPTGSYKASLKKIQDTIKEENKEARLALLESDDAEEASLSDEEGKGMDYSSEMGIEGVSSTGKKDNEDVAPERKRRYRKTSPVTILSKEETEAILSRKNIQTTIFESLGVSEEDYYKYIDPKLSDYDKSIIEKKFSKPIPGRKQLGEIQLFEFYHNILPKLEKMAKEVRGEDRSLPKKTSLREKPVSSTGSVDNESNGTTITSKKDSDTQVMSVLNTSSKKEEIDNQRKKERNMPKPVKTIFEYLGVSSEDYYKYIEPELSDSDKAIIIGRYGTDLEHPDPSIKLSAEAGASFYRAVGPRMRRMAARAGLIEPIKRGKPNEEKPEDTQGSDSKNPNPTSGNNDLPLPNENSGLNEDDAQQNGIPKNDGRLDEVPNDVKNDISSMDDKSLDDYISTLTLECQEIEARILEKRSKLDEAVSLYEKKMRLLAREKELDLEIAGKLSSDSKMQVKEKIHD